MSFDVVMSARTRHRNKSHSTTHATSLDAAAHAYSGTLPHCPQMYETRATRTLPSKTSRTWTRQSTFKVT